MQTGAVVNVKSGAGKPTVTFDAKANTTALAATADDASLLPTMAKPVVIPALTPPPADLKSAIVDASTTSGLDVPKTEVQRACIMCKKPLTGEIVSYTCKCKVKCVVHADCAPCPVDMAKMIELQVTRKAMAFASDIASRSIAEMKRAEMDRKQRDMATENRAGITADALFNFRQTPLSEEDISNHFKTQQSLPLPSHPVTPAGNMTLAPKIPTTFSAAR